MGTMVTNFDHSMLIFTLTLYKLPTHLGSLDQLGTICGVAKT